MTKESGISKTAGWIILGWGAITFWGSLQNGFVWDDRTFIQFNPEMSNLSLGYLAGANMFNNVNAGQYRFVVATVLTYLHVIFGEATWGYHIFQIGLHIINSWLVFRILKKFVQEKIALASSLIFLVHPMQVESVAYIASIGNPLFVCFGLMSLLLTMNEQNLSVKRLAGISGCLLASLMAKETGILFAGLIIFHIYLHKRSQLKKIVGMLGVTAGIYSWFRFGYASVYFSRVSLAPIARLDVLHRLMNTPAIIFYYLKTFIFPRTLIIEQYWLVDRLSWPNFWGPLAADVTVIGLSVFTGVKIFQKHRDIWKDWLFFGVWWLAGLGMYSQIYALDMTVADRWFYFTIIGLLGWLALSLKPLHIKIKNTRVTWGIFGLIICGLTVRTWLRIGDWKNPVTLYTHDLTIQENYDLENSLGAELNMVGQPDKAIDYFEKSVEIFPHETNLFNLGLAYEQMGKTDLAKEYYMQALNSPSYGEVPKPHKHHNVTYERLGILLLKSDPQSSLVVTKFGLEDYPNDAQLWYTRALAEYKTGQLEEAIAAAKNAFMLLPNNTDVSNLYQQLLSGKKLEIN